MRLYLSLILLPLFSMALFAQTCVSNVDTSGNLCTNFTTSGGTGGQSFGVFYVNSQDGVAATGSVAIAETYIRNQASVALPFDPLYQTYQTPNPYLNIAVTDTLTGSTPLPTLACLRAKNCPDVVQTYSLVATSTEQAPNYNLQFLWSGMLTITLRVNYVGCRGVCYNLLPKTGFGELSAVASPLN